MKNKSSKKQKSDIQLTKSKKYHSSIVRWPSKKDANVEINLDNFKKEYNLDEHKLSIDELCERYHTDVEQGLSLEQAQNYRLKNGPNAITPPKQPSEWIRLMENMLSLFNILLWIASFLCLVCYFIELYTMEFAKTDNLYLSIALALVVVISGLFSYYQESKSDDIMNSFKNMIPKYTTVIRSGQKRQISVEDLVVGDLVEIRGGDQIPADIRIVSSHGLKVDNSSLTGESEPLVRVSHCTDDNPLESMNLAFFSTNCIEGAGKGIVIRVGDNTSMGRIAILASRVESNETPLSADIHSFITVITYVSISFGMFLGRFSWLNIAILTISLIVAQIPEGLVPTLTVVLTLTAQRMAKKNCLVKNLHAVETLGSTSTICTDKTGTLTQNKMTVSHIWSNEKIIDVEKMLECPEKLKHELSSCWESLIRVACLCSKAEFSAGQESIPVPKREAIGDASEVAILRFMEIITTSVMSIRKTYPKIYEIPFNSTNKYSLTINKSLPDNGHWLCMKGAPEKIVERSSTIMIDGKEVPFDAKMRKNFLEAYENLGSFGERVIGLSERLLPVEQFPFNYAFNADINNFPIQNLCFIGLISLIDPPRPSVPDAVAKCRSAGIRVIMVTGDHPVTAKAIARAVGIISSDHETPEEVAARLNIPVSEVSQTAAQAIVVHGGDLKEFTETDLDDILRNYKEIVFARTSPQQKLIIVEGCQRGGDVVAVTGDGVNDSPALKKADIGIAMGITGSDVSKQAADIILLDDNFASIETGIEEGRVIFDNLKKSICYTLSSKMPELMPFLFYFMLGIPLALAPIYILCIDFGTDIVPAVSYGYEKAESDIMKRKPRNPKKDRLVTDRLISYSYGQLGMIEALAGFFVYTVVMAQMGFKLWDLIGIRKAWDSKGITDLTDSYGQEWTYCQRKELEFQSNTTFFVAVVITKCAALIVCKSRKTSIFTHKMRNHVMNMSIVFAIGVVLFLTYTPGMEEALNMYRLKLIWWALPLPFVVLMIAYCEYQKFQIRNNKGGWAEKEFYY